MPDTPPVPDTCPRATPAPAPVPVPAYLPVPADVPVPASGEAEPLTDVSVYEIGGDRPRPIGVRPEGTVAFYGLVLQARPRNERALVPYLLDRAVDGLWEYHRGYGVTPEDSCLVLDGLLAAGVPADRLRKSADRLVELFFDPGAGAFHSLSPLRKGRPELAQGRAAYWAGPGLDATAQSGWALHRIAPDAHAERIADCRRTVALRQQADGGWCSRWYPSRYVPAYYCLRLLTTAERGHTRETARAAHWLAESQRTDGSWDGTVISTAAAVLSLALLDREPARRTAALAWLRDRAEPHGEAPRDGEEQDSEGRWRGEPVLSFWFDFRDGRRLFHHCQDRGRITTAWARLALAAHSAGHPAPGHRADPGGDERHR
ncbi:hypothetical protein ABT354_31075 [Streptomyces sp. NPDC000594]|uniref:hypothetical protein n=1 Tax=Streptomyces sp. NPDC000594 TaxID=3154261 RepID=UPI003331AECE